MPSPDPEYIGTREAARILGVSVWTVTRKAKVGQLPGTKLGKSDTAAYVFLRSDIEALAVPA